MVFMKFEHDDAALSCDTYRQTDRVVDLVSVLIPFGGSNQRGPIMLSYKHTTDAGRPASKPASHER